MESNLSKEQLLKRFPDHKPTVFYSFSDNDFIEPVFTYYDRVELESKLLNEHNKNQLQGELFLFDEPKKEIIIPDYCKDISIW